MRALRRLLMALPLAGALTGRSLAQMTVFDPANYQQNLLSAVRALEQINNQIRALQNQAQVILRMDQNLTQLDATIAPDLQRMLVDIQGQLQAGQGIAMQLQATQTRYDALFRERLSGALSSDDALRNAKARWEEEYAAFRRSALLQGQIGGSIETDTRLLGEAMMSSRNAHGALEVVQAGNELTGLGVKQSLALQGLLATKARAETLTRARDLATEDEARQRFKTFVGTGTAYKASQ